ncbi:carboxypeptidase-like regulatory domain-containing protein [uncultured Lutibacter sp.]|uniref:carboxypeptidase-like regulatory domain-containing protein n=1 Tax=uncultured Lutibacter sp. TaxID=437739 RepID=UPI0026256FEA|nr:carboxypeptidase-like regulatory domain-containing protein [uncultured Lutibacter sp.]
MRNLFITLFIFTTSQIFSQSFRMNSLISEENQNFSIEGVILDSDNLNEPLFFAEIQVKDTTISATTDINGTFKFKLKPGTYSLSISFIGYKTIETDALIVTANNTIKLEKLLSGLKLQPEFYSAITVSQN